MKNAVLWDVTPCKGPSFGRIYYVRSTLQRSTMHLIYLRIVLQLPVTVNVVPSTPIPVTLMMEALCSF
jgi:hypothetical protein